MGRWSRDAQFAFALLASTSCDRPSEPCREPLDGYCVDCRTFEEALAEEEAAVDLGKWDSVAAFECGNHHLAIEYNVWFQHITEYYGSASGALLGVDSSSDVLKRCDGNRTLATVYGDVPECEATCVLFERCAEGATCESTLEPCEP